MLDRAWIALGLALASLPAGALACRCIETTPQAAIRGADGIVVARVGARDDRDRRFRTYRLEIERSWKTMLRGTVTVRSIRTDCMADLAVGRRYLVHLFKADGGWATEQCAGNVPIAAAQAEIRLLERGPAPRRAR